MKKFFIIWSLLISTISFDLLAQENVSVTIDKVIENGKIYDITTITNNNEHTIGVFNEAMIEQNGSVMKASSSYLIFSGYSYNPVSNNYSLVGTSNDVYFTVTGIGGSLRRQNIWIEKGESFIDKHRLFTTGVS